MLGRRRQSSFNRTLLAGFGAAALAFTAAPACAVVAGEVHGVITSAGTDNGLPDPHGLGVGGPLTVQYSYDPAEAFFLEDLGYSVVNANLRVFSGAYEFVLSDEFDGLPFMTFFEFTGGSFDDVRYLTNFALAFNDDGVLGIFLRSVPPATADDPALLFGTGVPLSNPECHRATAAEAYVCQSGGGGWIFDNSFAYGANGLYDNTYPGFGAGVLDLAGKGVPEPAVWALMILGFAAIGAMLRRRRAGLAVA